MKSFTNKLVSGLRVLVGTACLAILVTWAVNQINSQPSSLEPLTIHLKPGQPFPAISSFHGKNITMTKHGDTTDVYRTECIGSDNCEVIMTQAAAIPKKEKVAILIQDH